MAVEIEAVISPASIVLDSFKDANIPFVLL